VDVYPCLDAFFRRAQAAPLSETVKAASTKLAQIPERSRDPDWDFCPFSKPECGPIIGNVQRLDHTIRLRLWVEPYLFSAVEAPGYASPSNFNITRLELPDAANTPYPGTYWIYDVELPDDFNKDLRISIDYSDPRAIKFRAKTANSPQLHKKLALSELHHKRRVNIPLTKLPWFQRLKRNAKDGGAAFLVGSCHYPGSPFDEDLADKIYKSMLWHIDDSRSVTGDANARDIDHVLLVGDQIYADATADAFDTRELRERFARRYREAFGANYLRRLLASVPVHMAFDDHEFDDNWPGNA
jgi:cholesterol oxidase